VDTLSRAERSQRMSLVKSKDTKPELRVRRIVHALGYRYRLHDRRLPGSPDLVFAGRRKVLFVHGCFWHRHRCKMGNRLPKSRVGFWGKKLEENRRRDRANRRRLRALGWEVLVVWECQTLPSRIGRLGEKIKQFLDR